MSGNGFSPETRALLEAPYTISAFQNLPKEIIGEMLAAKGDDRDLLIKRAIEARGIYFPYGPNPRVVDELSNKCLASCDYCAMSKENTSLKRYTQTVDEIVDSVREVYKITPRTFPFKDGSEYVARFKRLFFQAGEHPEVLERVLPAIERINKEMVVTEKGENEGKPYFEIVCCFGELKKEDYKELAKRGVKIYTLKYETSNPDLYRKLKHKDLGRRLENMQLIKDAGLKLGTGNIVNLPGQTYVDLVNDLDLAQQSDADTLSFCPFMPNEGSKLRNSPRGTLEDSFNMNAASRVLSPKSCNAACSPFAKMDKEMGQQNAFTKAACTNITARITPEKYRKLYHLYSKDRHTITFEHVFDVLGHAVWNWEPEE